MHPNIAEAVERMESIEKVALSCCPESDRMHFLMLKRESAMDFTPEQYMSARDEIRRDVNTVVDLACKFAPDWSGLFRVWEANFSVIDKTQEALAYVQPMNQVQDVVKGGQEGR